MSLDKCHPGFLCSLQGTVRVQDGPQQESWHCGDGSLADLSGWTSAVFSSDIRVTWRYLFRWCSLSGPQARPLPQALPSSLKGNSLQTAWMLCPLNLKNLTSFCQLPSWGFGSSSDIPQEHLEAAHTGAGWWVGWRGLKSWFEAPPAWLSLLAFVHGSLCPGWSRVCLWPCFSLGLEWLVSGG